MMQSAIASPGADSCSTPPCEDAFLSVLEPDGQAFAYSTYLGGAQIDIANGLTIDSSNHVYVVGETYSTDFPTTPGAYDRVNTETNKRDAFILELNALGAPATPGYTHLDVPVSTSGDDAEENASGSSVTLTSTALELTQASTNQKVGLRFANVNLPAGATIQNAWIQFTVNAANSDVTNLTLQAEANDNAPTFVATANNISSRTKTTASVSWTPVAWNIVDEGGPHERTPNLASVMQEVVDRSGWASGHALAIIITGTANSKRIAKSYDRDTYGAPYLHIEYTLPGQLDLQVTADPATFPGAGQTITYTYMLTNTGTVALNGPYVVSDDKVPSVDCSAAQSPLAVGASTTCVGPYTTTPAEMTTGSVTDTASATASAGTQTITSNTATATITYPILSGPVTIDYVYDPLYRLKEANYSNGDSYHYTYDAAGNPLTQDKSILGLVTNDIYIYDNANRLASVNGITYTWDRPPGTGARRGNRSPTCQVPIYQTPIYQTPIPGERLQRHS